MAKRKKPTSKGGPYLAAALLCERTIEDRDGALSAIRIVDQFTLSLDPSAPPDFPSKTKRAVVNMTILLMFKTGERPGPHAVRVDMESPSRKAKTEFDKTVEFKLPETSGANIQINSVLAVYKGGLFWLHVFLDGKRVTRIPFQVIIKRPEPPPTDSTQPNVAAKKKRQSSE